MDQGFVIVGGEGEAACFAVREMPQHHFQQLPRKFQLLRREAQLLQLEHGIGEIYVIIEACRQERAAIQRGREQAPVAPQRAADEIERTGGGVLQIIARQSARRDRHAADHQRVPRGEDFLVAARTPALRANGEQLRTGRRQQRLDLGGRASHALRDLVHWRAYVQVPAPLEVRRPVETEARREHRELIGAERGTYLAAIPRVELALVTLRVGIEARVVAALGGLHLAHRPRGGLERHARIERIAAGERRLRVGRQQRAVVVQHLLEVRDHPGLIDRVTAEAASQLIVDPAFGHAAQRERRHVERLQVGLRRGDARTPVTQQPLDGQRVRKFWRAAKAAVTGIEAARQLRAAALERRSAEFGVARGRWRIELGECRHQRVVLRAQLRGMIAIVSGDALQDVPERWQPVARLLREVGAAEERPLVIVRQEHGERPAAAALREHLLRDLVDAVDVGTLLAIDFDIDEQLVEDACGGFVFEALFLEYVTPPAG